MKKSFYEHFFVTIFNLTWGCLLSLALLKTKKKKLFIHYISLTENFKEDQLY